MEAAILERLNINLNDLPAKLELKKGTNGHSRVLRFLVTGGCGYLGYELAAALHGLGGHVTMLDIQIPERIKNALDNTLLYIKGDISDYNSVMNACQGMDCVFHVASFGLTGKDQLNKEKTDLVNVQGTKNVIRACQENGVTKLIYTSSYNVVLGKRPILNGDDFVPYAPQEEMVDYYSKSKQVADMLVLAANESEVEGGGTLHTCCLRPAGIYGPRERRHTQRIVKMISRGLVLLKIGGDALVDWTHVNNLVQAHLLAIPGLSKASNRIAAGKAYFISDDNPVNLFDFLRPVFNGFGKQVPAFTCPPGLAYFFGFLMELMHWILKPFCCVEPLLTRNEVLKMIIGHYQNMSRAKAELGYRPAKYDFADVVQEYFKEDYPEYDKKYSVYGNQLQTSQPPEGRSFWNLVLVTAALLLLFICPMAVFL